MGFFSRFRRRDDGDIYKGKKATVTEVPNTPGPTKMPTSLDEIESASIALVKKAGSKATTDAKIKQTIIKGFKMLAPLAVLTVTIPESIYVFDHIYVKPDLTLSVLTAIFAVLVDVGYLFLTVLLELNKDARFKRLRAGMEVEEFEEKAVALQTKLWWIVALLDTTAQLVFMIGATAGSTFFSPALVAGLAVVRILSLFITMFVVSFAGTELMTDIDVVVNGQLEEVRSVDKIMVALETGRQKRLESRMKLRAMEDQQKQEEAKNAFFHDLQTDQLLALRAMMNDQRKAREEKYPDAGKDDF